MILINALIGCLMGQYTAIKHTPGVASVENFRYLYDKNHSPIWKHFDEYTGNGKYLYIYFMHNDILSRRNIRNILVGKENYFLHLDNKIVNDIKNNICKLVFEYTTEAHDFFFNAGIDLSLYYIQNTVKHYQLDKDQVIVCTGNLRAKTDGWPFHVVILNRWYHSEIDPMSEAYINAQTTLIKEKRLRKNKLLCLMRKAHYHRLWAAEKIFLKGLKDENLISMSVNPALQWLKTKFDNDFIDSLPWHCDIPTTQVVLDLFKQPVFDVAENLHLETYANFTVETWLGHSAVYNWELNLTEKIVKPIAAMQPFILAAQPRALEFLRSEGYKTFDCWWDESYDSEPDHYRRLELCVNIFEQLTRLSHTELAEMLYDMLPVLEHNQQLHREKFNKQDNFTKFLSLVDQCFLPKLDK